MFKHHTRKYGNRLRAARGQADTPWRRFLAWFEALFIDHGVFRLLFWNMRRVSDRMWRGAQPHPWQVRALGRRGVKTIVNLRGPRDCATYLFEKASAEDAGITLVDFVMTSREPPPPERLHALKDLFARIEYPALIHCKSGADRAGITAALYLLLHEGRPVEEAKKQLALKYGHIRQGRTGVLDHFFDEYIRARDASGIDFWTWVDTVYDPQALRADFHAGMIGSLIVDRLLRRE
ncbi:MAG: tyrosine-protein phosphatase [Zavarzinia sp.]|nr:tyrosine-protein phosphatase [Zavarzinia sp.]